MQTHSFSILPLLALPASSFGTPWPWPTGRLLRPLRFFAGLLAVFWLAGLPSVHARSANGDHPMPSTPSGKAIAVSPSQLNISWAVDIYTTSSDLQVATKANPTDADFSDLSSANVTSFQHKYLLPGKMYTYRLRACNSEGCSSYSQPFTGTTLVYQPLQAEAPTKVWDIRYGTSSPENYSKLIATKDGGYLLGGTTEGGQSGDKSQASRGGEDFWVVKVNQNGIKQWDKRFGGSGNE